MELFLLLTSQPQDGVRFHFRNCRTQATPRTVAPRCLRENLHLQTLPPTGTLAWKHLLLISAGLRNPNPLLGSRSCNYTDALPPPRPCCYSRRQAGMFSTRNQNGTRRWCFQPMALPVTLASFCPATMWCCSGLGCSTISLMAFSPISLSGRCPANPVSTD